MALGQVTTREDAPDLTARAASSTARAKEGERRSLEVRIEQSEKSAAQFIDSNHCDATSR